MWRAAGRGNYSAAMVLFPLFLSCITSVENDGSDPQTATSDTSISSPSGDTGTESTGATVSEPNVLLLSIDTTRADRVNSNGYTGSTTTPNLDALLASGLALRNHRSCSTWTMPSFLCVWTGQDALGLGVWVDIERGDDGLDPYPNDELPSLAWHLGEAGYATQLVTGNLLLGGAYNMDRGFDDWTRTFNVTETADTGIAELERLAADPSPWFLQIHFMAPHKPYNPDPAYLEGDTDCPGHDLTTRDGFAAFRAPFQQMSDEEQQACLDHLDHLYDALLRETDRHLQRVLDALDATGEREDTVIVFVTDHGESFQEHGFWEHSWGGNVDTLVRSTAGFVHPALVPAAEHHGLTTHEDILPTLFTLLGRAVPAGVTGHAVGTAETEAVFQLTYANDATVQPVATEDAKLIYRWDQGAAYYDLTTDPMELHDQWDPTLPEAMALWEKLEPKVLELADRVDDGAKPYFLP